MRTLAIGDIHGCLTALAVLEQYVSITPADRVVTLGDYIDRGPDSKGVIDWLTARRSAGRLVSLRGNHEAMMLAARQDTEHYDDWLSCGGAAALRSYARGGRAGELSDVPEAHWEFLNRHCLPYFETPTHIFVHANAYPHLPLDEQPDYMLYWEPFNDPPPHESGKVMICGHTPQLNGVPRSLGHAVCIDTWAHGNGWLTCLDVESGQYWQANERRQTRTAFLELAEST